MSEPSTWFRSNDSTLAEIRRPRSLTLISGSRRASIDVLAAIGAATQQSAESVTKLALTPSQPTSEGELLARLAEHFLLFDLETLCWPWLQLDPIRLLRAHSTRGGVVAVWPGDVGQATATFSMPGRRDCVSASAAGIIVLRPITTRIPDEVPFTLERISS